MMRQMDLVDRVLRYNPNANEDLLNRAYVYAMRAHGTQKRESGDPYLSHPLEVAAILTNLKLDEATIVAAVLHDTIEDTAATREDIDHIFGPEIGGLVEGLTKLKRLDLVNKRTAQAENFRKLLLAVAQDVRVLLVKLADRLHNMRTLNHVSPEKRRRIGEETLEIYAPLAGRMGMQAMRDELEDLSFRAVMPEAAATIAERLESLRKNYGGVIKRVEKDITEALAAQGIKAQVVGREKQPYSIWRKMERKSIAFEQLSDIYGFRVLVETTAECYAVLGVVHTRWQIVPGRFKDYISLPKENDYRSLHTTIVGIGEQRVELQVRTRAMHDIAENGIAAHALYKDGVPGGPGALNSESRAYQWLRRTIERLNQGTTSEEFLEHTKLELFHDKVFCFTPKGRLIALPQGATSLDFAYAVHTDVGNRAVGVKINGRIVPLMAPLHNGDEVEIAGSTKQTVTPAWEQMVVTGKARAAIRRATREARREQFKGFGRQILRVAFEKVDKAYSDESLKSVLPRFAMASLDDLLAAVGDGEVSASEVIGALWPDYKKERIAGRRSGARAKRSVDGWFGLSRAASLVFRVPGATTPPRAHESVPIRGVGEDMAVRFAPNGGAVPGDRIVGIITPGEGITIYPIQSPDLVQFDDQPERWLDVRWDVEDDQKNLFPARIVVTALNEPGTLGAVASLIGQTGANIDNIGFIALSPDFRDMIIDVSVWDLKHLDTILRQLRAHPAVSKAERVNG